MQTFAPHKLIARRKECGMGRTQLASAINRSFYTLRLYEQGKFEPPAAVLASLAYALDCSIGDFFEEIA